MSTGTKYQSKVVRRPFEDALLERVGPRTYYIQLEGFIFFASATQVLQKIKDLVDASNESVRHFFFSFFSSSSFSSFSTFFFFDLSSFSLLFPDILYFLYYFFYNSENSKFLRLKKQLEEVTTFVSSILLLILNMYHQERVIQLEWIILDCAVLLKSKEF